ncbi:MAG: hypothetical protein AB1758_02345 [Candidatus Eremiobacterota bacterium]
MSDFIDQMRALRGEMRTEFGEITTRLGSVERKMEALFDIIEHHASNVERDYQSILFEVKNLDRRLRKLEGGPPEAA